MGEFPLVEIEEMFFRALLGHAMTMCEAAQTETPPGTWPHGAAGDEGWKGLGNTSKQTFIRRACEDVGIEYRRYQGWLHDANTREGSNLDQLYLEGV